MLIELQPQSLPVQIPLEVQKARLHRHVAPAVHRGPGPHVGDGGEAGPVLKIDPRHIDPVAGDQHMGGHRQVRRGKEPGGAQAPPVADVPRQGVGVAQKAVRPLHLAHLHQAADVGGADGNPADLHLGNDVAADPQGGAFLL